jgi:fibronectin-binding autotransporter adhesin
MYVGYMESGSGSETGLVTIAGGTLDCNAMTLGERFGDGYLVMSNGVLLLRSAEIGRGGGNFPGRGTITFSGGAITNTGTLQFGNNPGSTGIVVQSGGIWIQGGATTIGFGTNTVGSITVTGGVFQANNTVTLGVINGANTGSGSLTVGGAGRVFVTNATGTALLDIKVGEFKLAGGTATVNRIVNGSAGALTLQGGRLKVLGSLTNNAAGPWVLGGGSQAAVLELATAATVTNRVGGGLALTNNAFLATSGKLGTNVTVVGAGGLEWTAVADTNASPGLALAGSGAVLAFNAARVLRLNNPQELLSSVVMGKTYTLMTWTGDDPATQPAWTIDRGTSALSGGGVQYDLPNNRLLLSGFTSGPATVVSIR